ncbi:MAG: M48 family metalloprotease [Nitrospira sp.]|nr:M48 family metalloprotease [Nitrospira sp.]
MLYTVLRLAIVSLLLLHASGCAVNPVSGRPELTLVSEEQEIQLGTQEAEKIEQQMGLVPDEALTRYLNALGKRLADESPRPNLDYQFHVVDMAEPNAFALPGGHIYVSRGILALANSEDELAGVVGHEIGHVAARHSVQTISKRGPFALIFGAASGLAGLVSPLVGNIIGGIGEVTQGIIFSPYSRSQENEADRVGQKMTAQSGWDPAGLSRLLISLDHEVRLHQEAQRKPSFFDTHPPTPDRAEKTAAYAKKLTKVSREPISASPEAFVRRLDGLVVGPRAANGVVQGATFKHPDLNFFVEFPDDWKIQNSPRKIIAAADAGEAAVVLGAVAEGNDPLDGAKLLEKNSERTDIVSGTSLTNIGGLPAARTQLSAEGKAMLDVTWIAYGGLIYQIVGMTSIKQFDAMKPVFHGVANSFRPLTQSERAGITETRIRLVTGRDGETIGALKQRAGSAWSQEEIAVVNGLNVSDKIREGQLLKVAIIEAYTSAK